jgi:hypothetical protein
MKNKTETKIPCCAGKDEERELVSSAIPHDPEIKRLVTALRTAVAILQEALKPYNH